MIQLSYRYNRDVDVLLTQFKNNYPENYTKYPEVAFFEGVVIFIFTYIMFRKVKKPGIDFWTWIGLYGLFRSLVEFVRQPDANLGHVIGFMTMGQILSSVMIISSLIGIGLILRVKKDETE